MEEKNKIAQDRVKAKAEKLVAFAKELKIEFSAILNPSEKGILPVLVYQDVEVYEDVVEASEPKEEVK